MATTNATISISSDIMSYGANINKTMTMKKFQSCNGLEETSGLRTKKFVATAATVVVEQDEFEATKAIIVSKLNDGGQSMRIWLYDVTESFKYAIIRSSRV